MRVRKRERERPPFTGNTLLSRLSSSVFSPHCCVGMHLDTANAFECRSVVNEADREEEENEIVYHSYAQLDAGGSLL